MRREFLQQLIGSALDVVTVLDDDGIIRYGSSSTERVLGYEPGELVGKSLFEFIHPDDVLNVINAFNDGLQIPGCIVFLEFRFLHKDSSWRNLDVIAKNLVDDPAVGGIVLHACDFTERVEKELRQRIERLQRTLEGAISALAAITEKRDPYVAGHYQRVTRLACAIAEEMSLPEERIEGIRVAGILHDIGKVNVPAQMLVKPSRLNSLELGLVKAHPQVGYDLLKTVELPWPVADILLQHHERIDGSGYPQGLSGEEILLEARILGVADVVDAMSSHRPYRSALGIDKALEEISRNKGILYDTEVVDACLRLFNEKGFKLE